MSCQQKSGVFLNINCENNEAHTCHNCDKEICETHHHLLEGNHCCEDCYWEIFLLTTETKRDHDTTTDYSGHDVIISTASTNTSNTKPSTTSEPEGFGGGFGGGQFSGGGAGASWTEGDMQSLDSVDGQSGLLTDNDDTFFYS